MEPAAKKIALENGAVMSQVGVVGRPETNYGTHQQWNDKTVYLDCNATTPLETSVLDAIYTSLKYAWGNPSSSYAEGKMAKRVIDESRLHVAKMVNCSPSDVIFTSGGTESNNMIFQSVMDGFNERFPSDTKNDENPKCLAREANGSEPTTCPHIITTNIEHDSVILALKSLQGRRKVDLTVLPVSKETGQVNVGDVTLALKWNTVLVSVMLANNETGVIQPIGEIAKVLDIANKPRAKMNLLPVLLHTDAAQAIGKIKVNSKLLEVDYLTIVGHKFYGPRIGALFVRELGTRDGAPLSPMFYGGGQERNYRPGTENTGMIAGLGEACRLVTENITCYEQYMAKVRDYLESRLEAEFKGRLHFNSQFRISKRLPNTCNVSILGPKVKGYKILAAAKCLQASVGAACHSNQGDKPSHILLSCGIPEHVASNAIRLSVGRFTSKEDIDQVVAELKIIVNEIESDS